LSIAEHQREAEALLRRTGSRVTRGRVVVLALLLEAKRALTHNDVESRIERLYEIDRVTVYRVLDWLTQQGLAHRICGDDRVWRFTAARDRHTGEHPHFKCDTCGEVICLTETELLSQIAIPNGYRSQKLEVTVKGQCADCAPHRVSRVRRARLSPR
jgi:Fur family ferric uptake transcriptional regulator